MARRESAPFFHVGQAALTSAPVAEMLVALMVVILTAAALLFAKRITPRTGVVLLFLALTAAVLVALRHNGLL